MLVHNLEEDRSNNVELNFLNGMMKDFSSYQQFCTTFFQDIRKVIILSLKYAILYFTFQFTLAYLAVELISFFSIIFLFSLQIISTVVFVIKKLANFSCNPSRIRGIPDIRRSQSQTSKIYQETWKVRLFEVLSVIDIISNDVISSEWNDVELEAREKSRRKGKFG